MLTRSAAPDTRLPLNVGTGSNFVTLAPGSGVCGTRTDALASSNKVGASNRIAAPVPAIAPISRCHGG